MQTEARGEHHPPGHQRRAQHAVMGGAHLVRRLGIYFGRKKAYIQKKSC
jgi:hypothetical protein